MEAHLPTRLCWRLLANTTWSYFDWLAPHHNKGSSINDVDSFSLLFHLTTSHVTTFLLLNQIAVKVSLSKIQWSKNCLSSEPGPNWKAMIVISLRTVKCKVFVLLFLDGLSVFWTTYIQNSLSSFPSLLHHYCLSFLSPSHKKLKWWYVIYGWPQSANEMQSNLPRRSRHLMAKFPCWLQTLHIGSSSSKYVLEAAGWLVCSEMCFCPWIYSNFPIIFLWSGCPHSRCRCTGGQVRKISQE